VLELRIFRERVDRFIDAMKAADIDAALLLAPPSVQYFTGCKTVSYPPRTLYSVVWSDGGVVILAPKLELNQVNEEAALGEVVEVPRGKPIKAIIDLIVGKDVKRLGVESGRMPYLYADKIRAKGVELVDVHKLVMKLRSVKDAYELELLKKAVRISEEGLKAAMEWIGPGLSEKRVMYKVVEAMLERGAEWPSFEVIVASGFRAAYPHGVSTDKIIGRGETVIVDVGARVEGYHGDLTRTFLSSPPDNEKLADIIDVVDQAVSEALKAIRPGVRAGDVDLAARKVVEEAGYGEYFTHGLGHGIGLDIHEEPFLRPRSEWILQEGNVFTVEPGIYIPGLGGARIEEDVVVTKGGVQPLSRFPRKSGFG